jgi:bifunctional non-homologous end joining protein LigD
MKKVRFVIHDHKAKRAGYHQDLRFEDPIKKNHWHSFAVPKTVPLAPGKKVLAIKTHIHTKDQALFKGDIPAGEYGGGNIELFDQGIAKLEKFTSASKTWYGQPTWKKFWVTLSTRVKTATR